VNKNKLLYDLETLKIYATDVSEQLIVEFSDAVKGNPGNPVSGKGILNNKISAQLLNYLASFQIPTNLMKVISDTGILVKEAQNLPLECQILNVATKSLNLKFGVPLEKDLEHPILEYYTVDTLGNRILINDTHAVALNIVKIEEMQYIERISLKANVILKAYFARRDFKLVEFKLTFGRYKNHIIVLNDLSLDSIHIWDLISDIHYQSEFFAQNCSEIPALVDELRRRILGE